MTTAKGVKTVLTQKTRTELELEVEQGFLMVAKALMEVKDRELYKEISPLFEEYLLKRWGKSYSWFSQITTSAAAAKLVLEAHDAVLGNESAARGVRMVLHRQVNEELLPRILAKAQRMAGNGNPIMGKHIKSVISVTCETLDTGGLCWVEGGGQVAFDAAVTGEVAEAMKRQQAYIMAGNSAKGWSAPIKFQPIQLASLPIYHDLPKGKTIELRWRACDD